MSDRRPSPLAAAHPAWQGESPSPAPANQPDEAAPTVPTQLRPAGSVQPVVSRSRRRRRAAPLGDLDLVSFNCNVTVALRRAVRTLAAQLDVDIQDIVEVALAQYLEQQGIDVPRRPMQPERPQ